MTGPYGYLPPVARPRAYDRLLRLTLASAGCYVLTMIAALVGIMSVDLTGELEATGTTGALAEELNGTPFRLAVAGFATFFYLVGLVLYGVVYAGLRSVGNWARITGTVFAGLWILSTLLDLADSLRMGAWGIVVFVIELLSIAVAAWWIVAAFREPINAYVDRPADR